jgi:hypothetical protein
MNPNFYLWRLRKLLLMPTIAEEESHKPPKSDFRFFNEEVHSKPHEIDLGFDFGPWKFLSLHHLIHLSRNHNKSKEKQSK